MGGRWLVVAWLAGVLGGGWCWGQQPVALRDALAKAAAQAQVLASDLPGFTCTEAGTSELRHEGKVKKQVGFTAAIRAQRNSGGELEEAETLLTVGGKAVGKRQQEPGRSGLPFHVHEAFTDVLTYVDARAQPCFLYTVGAEDAGGMKVDFQSAEPYEAACGNLPGTVGEFTADAQGNVTHMERTVPAELGEEGDVVPFAAVDLAPVELGGRTYWLASHVVSERDEGKDARHFEASYTGCKLFRAEITIHAGGVVPEGGDESAPKP
jgi:hypothetical protein